MRPLIFALSLLTLGHSSPIDKISGNFKGEPDALVQGISPKARLWLQQQMSDISAGVVDLHIHLVGSGHNGSGLWINPDLVTWTHPKKHIQFLAYMSAGGMRSLATAEQDYWRRLKAQAAILPANSQLYLLAFDAHYRKNGSLDSTNTEFIVPNTYAHARSQEETRFRATVSINPYKRNAIEEVHAWGAQGVRFIKWLPNAMGIDPADSALVPFYLAMKQHHMALLTHAGEEQAVDAAEFQKLGNPLRLRLPLDLGVPVVIAHCASLGMDEDLDKADKPRVPSFSLFARLMDTPRYKDLVYGDLSAVAQSNRYKATLGTLLARKDWHSRLINGSDYPLPAVNALFRTSTLRRAGYLSAADAKYLNEVYGYNPLLFDILLKKSLRHPRTQEKFPASIFALPATLQHKH